jgi:ASCH domain
MFGNVLGPIAARGERLDDCLTVTHHPFMPDFALSLKQPWATLLVHGYKSVEVRNWPTARRGRILIHAARVSDPRPEAWALVPSKFKEAAEQLGGLIGLADLTGCVAYRSLKEFVAARHLHLNEPEWFKPPVLYGFVFANAEVLPFRPLSGWMRFFSVPAEEKK